MDYSERFTIQLTIGSKQYPLEVNRVSEKIYRDAAALINDRIHTYINNFPNQATEDYMAMTLIDITAALMKETNQDDVLRSMIQKIDQTLKLNKE